MKLPYIQDTPCTCASFKGFKATPKKPHHHDCARTAIIGTECLVCKHPIYSEVMDGGRYIMDGCSEFCALASDQEREGFLKLKGGEYGAYPCFECGCTIEDEYEPESNCSSCSPKVEIRTLKARIAELEKIEDARIQAALDYAVRYGGIDEEHHKVWVIDQMVRALTGCPEVPGEATDANGKPYTYTAQGESEEYKEFVRDAKAGKNGPNTYSWREGICP